MTTVEEAKQLKIRTQLTDYLSQALATADKQAFDLQYLIPAIVGEVGELFGQNAKAHWHGWDADELQAQLVKEYGDIAWMTAVLIHVRTTNLAAPNIEDLDLIFKTRLEEDPKHLLLMRATALHLYYTMGLREYILDEAARLWAALAEKCEAITGVSFQDVLDHNIDKLTSRAARGVLKGQGDNR